MCKAFSEIYPNALLTVNYQVSNAMYGTIDNMNVTEEMIEKVRNRMQEIIVEWEKDNELFFRDKDIFIGFKNERPVLVKSSCAPNRG
jgi:hypothetical protein